MAQSNLFRVLRTNDDCDVRLIEHCLVVWRVAEGDRLLWRVERFEPFDRRGLVELAHDMQKATALDNTQALRLDPLTKAFEFHFALEPKYRLGAATLKSPPRVFNGQAGLLVKIFCSPVCETLESIVQLGPDFGEKLEDGFSVCAETLELEGGGEEVLLSGFPLTR